MHFTPYLNFNGNCAEAFRFYERVLGGKITFMQTHGESPMADQVPAEMGDLVMHVSMEVNGQVLMASDSPPEYYHPGSSVWVSIHLDEPAEAERVYAELSEGGDIKMPIGKTFWAGRFAMFIDRYGTPWMINCEKGD
ncbi:MAG TPA: VOC family protein [Longimicrobium sp.]|nr:VOC family protein [Longimicrobium sp.]